MLGLLELGAAQDLSEGELCRLAKTANGYWYPSQYVETALFFATIEDTPGRDVDPATAVCVSYGPDAPPDTKGSLV